MHFDFTLGNPSDSTRRRERGPVRRLLILSDLRGNGARPAEPLLDRRTAKVDIDNLDAVLARYAPVVQLGADAGGERVEIRRFEDFHPDTLIEALSVFRRLRDVRARLEHPSSFAGAAAELAAQVPAIGEGPGSVAAGASPSPSDVGLSTLDQLLRLKEPSGATAGHGDGRTESGRETPTTVADPARAIDALIRQAVAPHIVPAPSPQLPQMLSAVDAAMTDLMRAVLHDHDFQALEAAWRGVQWLVSRLDLGETLELHLLHVTRDELAQTTTPGGDLWRRLVDRESQRDGGLAPFALVGNLTFGPSADDLAVLEHLGTLAAALGATFIAGASPSLLGTTSLASQPDPRSWTSLDGATEARWQALRAHPAAAFIGLALPRVLLRLPYGQRTDPIAAFPFAEQTTPPTHESFLWGNPAVAYGVALARALDEEGDTSTAGSIGGLPAFVYTTDDGTALQSPAEIGLAERAVEAIQARGLMPVISFRDRDDIQLLTPLAIALSPRSLLA